MTNHAIKTKFYTYFFTTKMKISPLCSLFIFFFFFILTHTALSKPNCRPMRAHWAGDPLSFPAKSPARLVRLSRFCSIVQQPEPNSPQPPKRRRFRREPHRLRQRVDTHHGPRFLSPQTDPELQPLRFTVPFPLREELHVS